MKILVIEKVINEVDSVIPVIEQEFQQYQLLSTDDCSNGIAMMYSQNPELILINNAVDDADIKSFFNGIKKHRIKRDTMILNIIPSETSLNSLEESLSNGADTFLRKPYVNDELLTQIRILIKKRY